MSIVWTPAVMEGTALRFMLMACAGWWSDQRQEAVAYERNHQGLGNELIDGVPSVDGVNRIHRRQRLGGLLNYYARAA